MKYLFSTILVISTVAQCYSTGPRCGTICDNFSYESGDLAVCSSMDRAEVWNTTSGECQSSMIASLDTVSWMSQIFTAGVTPAVRRQIGDSCWDSVPEKVAIWTIRRVGDFDPEAVCYTYPTANPSLGWEMRYGMEVLGFSDCSAMVDLHQNALIACVRYEADGRGLATFCYMVIVVIGMILFAAACVGMCSFCCG